MAEKLRGARPKGKAMKGLPPTKKPMRGPYGAKTAKTTS